MEYKQRRPSRGPESVDRLGGSLVNVILGALILWVGQTTFHHAGMLASIDERFESVGLQFNTVNSRHEGLRHQLEKSTTDTVERTQSRFTQENGQELELRIQKLGEQHVSLERQLVERNYRLELKVTSLEADGNNRLEVSRLRSEVDRLRMQIARQPRTPLAAYSPGERREVAAGGPAYLPPVTQTR